MYQLLISGFEPWADHARNSSLEFLEYCRRVALPTGWQLRTVCLPVAWDESARLLKSQINPATEIVIAFGLAANRLGIHLERAAFNRRAVDKPDGRGRLAPSPFICGPDVVMHSASLQYATIQRNLREAQLEVVLSNDAGDYLCNEVLMQLMCHRPFLAKPSCGFIHLPPSETLTPEQWQAAATAIITGAIAGGILRYNDTMVELRGDFYS
jgi:pyroglutamyl-peptidase